MVTITSQFDGGNIIVKDLSDPQNIRLDIRKDNQSEFYQWFYYRLTGAHGTNCIMHLENAAGAAYPKGWDNYQAVASYDRQEWFRVPTSYENGVLTISHTPEKDSIYYAYFAPFSMERHADLIGWAQEQSHVTASVAGQTLDGQDIDVLVVGDIVAKGKLQFWITARQHPGEIMAEWWMEGFLDRLTDPADPVARTLRDKAVFYVVPNMNPDGSRRGHLRTNAAGVNLNREWSNPSPERSPEVFHVLNLMRSTGIDFALDVHGDEALPYNFIAGAEGVPSFTDRDHHLLSAYKEALKSASPDFQTVHGYPPNPPGTANMGICTHFLVEEFRCLAMTLEMPFKDTVETPDLVYGWSPARAATLGAASLDAMLAVLPLLRL